METRRTHHLIAIGYIGGRRVYVDVPIEEAKQRYKESEGVDPDADSSVHVSEFDFTDEFGAYGVWE